MACPLAQSPDRISSWAPTVKVRFSGPSEALDIDMRRAAGGVSPLTDPSTAATPELVACLCGSIFGYHQHRQPQQSLWKWDLRFQVNAEWPWSTALQYF